MFFLCEMTKPQRKVNIRDCPRAIASHPDRLPRFCLSVGSNERQSMRKPAVLAILAALVLSANHAQAQQRPVRPLMTSTGQGPINRLIELERRKNAALRQMFFGR